MCSKTKVGPGCEVPGKQGKCKVRACWAQSWPLLHQSLIPRSKTYLIFTKVLVWFITSGHNKNPATETKVNSKALQDSSIQEALCCMAWCNPELWFSNHTVMLQQHTKSLIPVERHTRAFQTLSLFPDRLSLPRADQPPRHTP